MTALALTPVQMSAAEDAARHIGAAFASARRAADDTQQDVAGALVVRREMVSRFECGEELNVKLGTITKFLELYGLTLVVVSRHATIHQLREATLARGAES